MYMFFLKSLLVPKEDKMIKRLISRKALLGLLAVVIIALHCAVVVLAVTATPWEGVKPWVFNALRWITLILSTTFLLFSEHDILSEIDRIDSEVTELEKELEREKKEEQDS
jgi:hypothetical protein